MSLQFILGMSGYGKTYTCMNKILENNKEKSILIVPEQFTSQAERDILELSPKQAIIHCEIISFGRLASKIFLNYGIGSVQILDDIGKSISLQKTVLQLNENKELKYFANMITKSGFIDQLNLIFSEFVKYHIDPEILLETVKNNNLPQNIQEKLEDLCKINNAYHDFLSTDFMPSEEKLTILSNILQNQSNEDSGKQSLLLKNIDFSNSYVNDFSKITFYIDGFYNFTPQEMSVIQKLCKISKDVIISLPLNEYLFNTTFLPYYSPFIEPYTAKSKIIKQATENNIKISKPTFLTENKRSKNQSLVNLEKNFFSAKKSNLKDGVTIFSSPNIEAEVTSIINNILKLVKTSQNTEKPIRYKDIAIVTNDLENYAPLFMSTLSNYNIPYFIDRKRTISNHPLITMISSLLNIVSFNFSYEYMFAYLKSGLSDLSFEEVDILENYVLAYGIKSYKWTSNTPWQYGLKTEGEETIDLINSLRERVIKPLEPFLKLKISTKLTAKDFIKLIIDHLKELNVNIKITGFQKDAILKNNHEKAKEHEQVWEIIFDLFEKVHNILSDELLPFEHYQKILLAGISKSQIGIIPATLDCIVVGDFERSRLPEVSHLFVAGVNDGVLPSVGIPQGLFTETEREAIKKIGIDMAVGVKQLAFQEHLLIYYGFTKPSEHLYLSYYTSDLNGKTHAPSNLISKIMSLNENPEDIDNINNSEYLITNTMAEEFDLNKHTIHTAFKHLYKELDNEEVKPIWENIYQKYYKLSQSNLEWKHNIDILNSAFEEKIYTTKLSKKSINSLYNRKNNKQISTSVSKLERYSSCPFAYYMQYNLKAKERQIYKINTPDLGILFHDVLDQFSKTIVENKIPWSSIDSKDKVREKIDVLIDNIAPNLNNNILFDNGSNKYLVKRLKRISTTATWGVVRHIQAGKFIPTGNEIEFGLSTDKDMLPPIHIKLSNGTTLVLSGKIDRVDILDQNGKIHIKVIDYKSGSTELDFQKIFYGLQLQLFVYMEAYLKHCKKDLNDVLTAGAFYFHISDPSINIDKSKNPDEIQKELYKAMKMSGLVFSSRDVISAIDSNIDENATKIKSDIVNVEILTDGNFSKSSSVATEEDFSLMLNFVNNKVIEIGNEILEGNVDPSPYKYKTSTPCDYCQFGSICRYDYYNQPNYRVLSSMNSSDFWKEININNE